MFMAFNSVCPLVKAVDVRLVMDRFMLDRDDMFCVDVDAQLMDESFGMPLC